MRIPIDKDGGLDHRDHRAQGRRRLKDTSTRLDVGVREREKGGLRRGSYDLPVNARNSGLQKLLSC